MDHVAKVCGDVLDQRPAAASGRGIGEVIDGSGHAAAGAGSAY